MYSSAVNARDFAGARPKQIVVDEKQETTTLQLVLHDKQRYG